MKVSTGMTADPSLLAAPSASADPRLGYVYDSGLGDLDWHRLGNVDRDHWLGLERVASRRRIWRMGVG